MDPFVVEKYLPFFVFVNEDELHGPFCRGEVSGRPVRLFVCRDKAHVSYYLDEGIHVAVATNFGRVPHCVIPGREYHDHQK